MNTKLAPTYKNLYGNHWVLWYSNSNSYTVVDTPFKNTLDIYFQSESKLTFLSSIASKEPTDNKEQILKDVESYLKVCNLEYSVEKEPSKVLNIALRKIQKTYRINDKKIKVYTDSELILKIFHPALCHLEVVSDNSSDAVFDIHLIEDHLLLFKNGKCLVKIPKRDYHFIRGKFIMHIFCEAYNKNESDWLGTFHGSTITNNNTSILFIGETGSGKSTLSSLLVANGYYLLADDISPMLAENTSIYHNPNGISIKDTASEVLRSVIKNYDDIPIIEFNSTKGPLRYYASKNPPKNCYACSSIVLVNYSPGSQTELTEVTIKDILQTLIPESWLSPKPAHAKTFLKWLKTVKLYKLTYSDNNSMVSAVGKLFEAQG